MARLHLVMRPKMPPRRPLSLSRQFRRLFKRRLVLLKLRLALLRRHPLDLEADVCSLPYLLPPLVSRQFLRFLAPLVSHKARLRQRSLKLLVLLLPL